MKTIPLIDLEPRWVKPNQWSTPEDKFQSGLSFICPNCRTDTCSACGRGWYIQRVVVQFWPPIDPEGLAKKWGWPRWPEHMFDRSEGETFETLTIDQEVHILGHGWFLISKGILTAQDYPYHEAQRYETHRNAPQD